MPQTVSMRSPWQRLKKNKGAMFGLCIICLSLLVACTCYLISTDHSTNANRMVIEIGGKKPGYSQLFLKIHVRGNEQKNFLQQILSGQSDDYQYLPITHYQLIGDSIIVEKLVDDGISESQHYSVSKLNSAFPPLKYEIRNIHFWLGTDKYGRDILSRLLIGVRVSLAVGLITVIISLSIGVLLGAIAGYFRGWVD